MERTASVTLRASAALPASGAYDASPTSTVLPAAAAVVYLHAAYTIGAAGGYAGMIPEGSNDGTNWYALSYAGTAVIAQPSATLPLHRLIYELPRPADGSAVRVTVPVDAGGWTNLRVRCAEIGITATPGTLEVSLSGVS